MTYIIPHLRYGALVHENETEEFGREAKKRKLRRERIQKILNRTIKDLYNLPKSTPNDTINKMMGS